MKTALDSQSEVFTVSLILFAQLTLIFKLNSITPLRIPIKTARYIEKKATSTAVRNY